MTGAVPTVWGVHAGRTGDAHSLFLNSNCVAVGWAETGDLSKLAPTREAFRARIEETHGHHKPGALPVFAGVLYRFVHEIAVGDIVVYPSKTDREVHIGRVTGGYRFDASRQPSYPHRRPVSWVTSVPRTRFTQGALYEIGSAVSLFQIKNYASEFLAAMEGKTKIEPTSDDETIPHVAEDIEQTTRDFILKTLARDLKGHPMADFVAHLLNAMGYRTRVSPEGPDGGIDIVAHKDELGFEPPIIKVQVKSSEGTLGDPAVTALYGKVGSGEYAMVVTLGTFTPNARNFARSKSNLRLVDGDELVGLVLQHYEQFDSRYKGLLPLKRVYVPQTLEEDGDGSAL